MRQEWEPEDLIEVWTLLEEDQERLRNKSGGQTGWGSLSGGAEALSTTSSTYG
ncbi:hypothetical protein SAMN05216532_0130 [Streptomyces sp. 2231.1]|uniref:hypothetical protein n=1 Tax=Streptomyces sp. 2231.1 TaxID=1855347 RepID=UPI00089D3CFB|nr:hypothetical protein [Streptomyces sp. 2231.1]SEB99225.1 hypothetical protein SAMN05216532_0130 [Streptomyces sp. 2231.1]